MTSAAPLLAADLADGPQDEASLRAAIHQLHRSARDARSTLNLVPSENRLSPLAAAPLSTDFRHRYFFNDSHDPGFWQFRGGQDVSRFETSLALPALRRLAAAEHVNVRPISGMSAMLVAMAALGGAPGNTVVSIAATSGGHFATTSVARRLGFVSRTVPVDRGAVEEGALRDVLRTAQPQLVYLDLQNTLFELDVAPVARAISEESPATLLHVDCSHPLGLILGGAAVNPLDAGADVMGGSTHKTFPGPHKGALFTRRADLRDRLVEAQFCLISSHHFADTLSLGLAAAEYELFGREYARQVVRNGQAFGRALLSRGFDVVHDGGHVTDSHQVWVRIGAAGRTDELAERLFEAGIRVNVQVDLPGLPGLALRLGVSEMTFEGAREWHFNLLADAFVPARDGKAERLIRARTEVWDAMTDPFHLTGDGPAEDASVSGVTAWSLR